MPDWPADAVYAYRRLRSAPFFTLFSILTLALAIGATTAIYSVVYAAVLRPLPIADIDRVANLYHMDPRQPGSGPMQRLARADYDDYRAAQTSFEFLSAWKRLTAPVVVNGATEMLFAEAVGGEYFSVVGIRPALGRVIQPADDRPGATRVIVLSDALWRRAFAGDRDVVGRTVKLGERTFEIVGVAPPVFRGVDMPNVAPTGAWIPLAAAAENAEELTDRDRRTLSVKGRLKPGASMAAAQAEFRAVGQRLDLAYPIGTTLNPRYRRPGFVSRPWFLMPAANVKMHESVDPIAGPLVAAIMVAVGLVLLVACTNVANLVLARDAARRHEVAVRLALGATRWRLVREHLVESLLVAVAGAAGAFAVARLLMVRVLSAELRPVPGISLQFAPEMNASVAVVALASTVIALIVFGVIPAMHASRGSLRSAMASDGGNAPIPRWRGRRGLIACQVAVSAGLVSIAALCAQQIFAVARHDRGIDIDRLALVRVTAPAVAADEARGRWILEQVLEAARRLPGVEAAALSSGFPIEMGSSAAGSIAVTPDQFAGGRYTFLVSTPGVFTAWGVKVLQGRTFDERDTASSERVAVLTERQARSLFPEGPAVGREFVLRKTPLTGQPPPPIQTMTVIGIVADTDVGETGNRGGGLLYLPWSQHYTPTMTVTVRSSGNPAALIDPVKRLVARLAPDFTVLDAVAASTLGNARTLVLRIGAAAAGLLGGLALILALAGLYGVLSELVLRRTRELGIRMALGADARRLLRMVLLDGTRPVVVGLAIGLGCGVILRLAFRPLFIRLLPAFDALTIALVPVAFIAAALLASYFPARRAARVDPNVALRHL